LAKERDLAVLAAPARQVTAEQVKAVRLRFAVRARDHGHTLPI